MRHCQNTLTPIEICAFYLSQTIFGLSTTLIVAANRDKFFARPSKAAHFWDDISGMLAGRDEQAGGTWLGINRQGQFTAVTNFRIPSKFNSMARSRGDLATNFLTNDPEQDFYNNLETDLADYNPFNLVVGDAVNLSVFSSEAPEFQKLTPGCHPISNGLPGDHWPKMSRGASALRSYLEQALKLMFLIWLACCAILPEAHIASCLTQALASRVSMLCLPYLSTHRIFQQESTVRAPVQWCCLTIRRSTFMNTITRLVAY